MLTDRYGFGGFWAGRGQSPIWQGVMKSPLPAANWVPPGDGVMLLEIERNPGFIARRIAALRASSILAGHSMPAASRWWVSLNVGVRPKAAVRSMPHEPPYSTQSRLYLSSRSGIGTTKTFFVTAPRRGMQRQTMSRAGQGLLTLVAWNAKHRPGILPTGVAWENTMDLEMHRILLAAIIVIVIIKIKVIVNRR
jgi:hypothetical protein